MSRRKELSNPEPLFTRRRLEVRGDTKSTFRIQNIRELRKYKLDFLDFTDLDWGLVHVDILPVSDSTPEDYILHFQSDVWHLDNFQSTWRWNVSNGFNNSLENPVLFQTQLYYRFGWKWSWGWTFLGFFINSWVLESSKPDCLSPKKFWKFLRLCEKLSNSERFFVEIGEKYP